MPSTPAKLTKKQLKAQRRAAKQQLKTSIAPQESGPTLGQEWMYVLPAVLLALAVFAQTLGFDFVNWDDDVNILENRNVLTFDWKGIFTERVIGNYNPLPILTFALEHALVGTKASLYHFNNLWLHLVNVVLVYSLGRRLRLDQLPATLLAALFAIHPLRVESVAWVTERKDVLFTVFYFAALLQYEKHRQAGASGSWFWGVAGLAVLALFSKIQAVSLPLSMLCLDYLRQRELRLKEVFAKAPYFAMSLAMGLLGIYFLGSDGSLKDAASYTFFERLAIGSYAYTIYVIKAVVPYEMSPLYPYPTPLPWHIFGAFASTLAALGLGAWAYFKGHVKLAFGLAFFTVNVMFLLQVLGAGQGFLADRFTYVGYFGLFWLIAVGVQQLLAQYPKKRGLLQGLGAAYLLGLAVLAGLQTRIWENGGTLWEHVTALYPKAATAHGNYGQYVRDNGRPDEALVAFTRAIETDTQNGTYHNSRGKLHFDQGRNNEAIADYTAGIAKSPELAELHVNRGAAYAQGGQFAQGLEDLNRGLALDPKSFNGYFNRSLLYYSTNRPQEAVADYTQMLRMRPERHDLWRERGALRAGFGEREQGLADIRMAIKLAPNAAIRAKYEADLAKL